MEQDEIKDAIKAKSKELEMATESGRPRDELLKLYKELKELQFQKVQQELAVDASKDFDLV